MPEMNRRDALKVLGLAPLAASLGVAPDHLDRVSRAVARLEQTGVAAPTFFSAHEWSTVRLLVDYIIPRDERSGSATDAKVPEFIDFLMADNDASLASRTAMHGGLAWLDNECRNRFDGKTFVLASDAQRKEVLDDIAYPRKAKPEHSYGVTFFNRFRDLTASGFFSSQMGWQDVQYKGNVALPAWNGCPPAALAKLGVSY